MRVLDKARRYEYGGESLQGPRRPRRGTLREGADGMSNEKTTEEQDEQMRQAEGERVRRVMHGAATPSPTSPAPTPTREQTVRSIWDYGDAVHFYGNLGDKVAYEMDAVTQTIDSLYTRPRRRAGRDGGAQIGMRRGFAA